MSSLSQLLLLTAAGGLLRLLRFWRVSNRPTRRWWSKLQSKLQASLKVPVLSQHTRQLPARTDLKQPQTRVAWLQTEAVGYQSVTRVCVHAGVCNTLVMRVARDQGLILKLSASTASTYKVVELLRRISLNQSQDQVIPCCAREEDLPVLPRLTQYAWVGNESSDVEVAKGRK